MLVYFIPGRNIEVVQKMCDIDTKQTFVVRDKFYHHKVKKKVVLLIAFSAM
jgi:hypothetical protein